MNKSNIPPADPAAVFAIAVSLYKLADRKELDLSEAFQGFDQFMRECMRIGQDFEAWACEHVDFDELDEVWPYLLEEKFLEALERVLGNVRLWGSPHELTYLREEHFEKIFKTLITSRSWNETQTAFTG